MCFGGGGWERSSGGGHRVTHVIVARNGVSNAMSSRSGWRNDENNASNATASVQPSIEIRVSRWRLTPVEQIFCSVCFMDRIVVLNAWNVIIAAFKLARLWKEYSILFNILKFEIYFFFFRCTKHIWSNGLSSQISTKIRNFCCIYSRMELVWILEKVKFGSEFDATLLERFARIDTQIYSRSDCIGTKFP